MNLILFPGNSRRSGDWLIKVEEALAPNFQKTFRQSYEHWDNNLPEINLDRELERISGLHTQMDPYFVFAKSAGTMLTLKAMSEEVIHPKACLLTGIPLVMIHDHNLPIGEWLRSVNIPITILQNENDPFGSFDDVKGMFESAGNLKIEMVSLSGDSHDYTDFNSIAEYASKLV